MVTKINRHPSSLLSMHTLLIVGTGESLIVTRTESPLASSCLLRPSNEHHAVFLRERPDGWKILQEVRAARAQTEGSNIQHLPHHSDLAFSGILNSRSA